MTTRAKQITFLLSGLRDPDDDSPLNGGSVEFYEAGTLTAKSVWTEKEKTNSYTSYTLDSNGQAQLYGDGIYKVIVKDSAGNTEYTWDDVKIQSTTFSIVTKTGVYTATPDDDVILCNGTFTLSLEPVANFEHPLTIKNIGTGTVTIDPDGTETIDGLTTLAIATQNQTFLIYPDNTAGTWRRGYSQTVLSDADGDTKVQVEESADDDTIRFDAAGSEMMTITSSAITVAGTVDLNGNELVLDADGDTSITADTDDVISIKVGGGDDFEFRANQLKLLSGSNVRLVNNEYGIIARNAANTADQDLLKLNSDDDIEFASVPAIFNSTMRIPNNTYFKIRNNADNADLSVFRATTSDNLSVEIQSFFSEQVHFQSSDGIRLTSNDAWILGRNALDSANINIVKVNSDNHLEFGAVQANFTSIIRIPSGVYFKARNNAGTGDVSLFRTSSADNLVIEPSTYFENAIFIANNNDWLSGRNAADSANVNMWRVNTTDDIEAGADVDLNGNELILDADGDTSLHVSTDDQIDIKIANADDFQFTANTFTALSGSVIKTNTINETTAASGITIDGVVLKDSGATLNAALDMQGNEIVLDADNDTSITADTDDQIDIKIANADDFQFSANTFTALSGSAIKTDTINETTAAAGVTIDSLLIKDGGLVAAGAIDANGQELTLDADADTSITADTDDQIDIKIANADDFRFTANDFTALSGSAISTDTINETTAAAGVTIDGLNIKDSKLVTSDSVVTANITDDAVTAAKIGSLPAGDSGCWGPLMVWETNLANTPARLMDNDFTNPQSGWIGLIYIPPWATTANVCVAGTLGAAVDLYMNVYIGPTLNSGEMTVQSWSTATGTITVTTLQGTWAKVTVNGRTASGTYDGSGTVSIYFS